MSQEITREPHCPRCDDSQSLHQFSEGCRIPWLCVACGHEFREPVLKVRADDYDRLVQEREALQRRVQALEAVLMAVEWRGHNFYCPMCDGWEAEKGRGATPGKHAKDCELKRLLPAPPDAGGQTK